MLHDQPKAWASIDRRLRALSLTDDLIARVDGSGCDIKDLLLSELGPYGHVRFTLNGDPLSSAPVTVANTAPVIDSVVVRPAGPKTNETLEAKRLAKTAQVAANPTPESALESAGSALQ